MGFFDSALAFVEGIKSVIDVSGAVQGTISDAISNGIENAFKKIRKPLERSMMKISFLFVSVFFMIGGIALFLDNFVPYRGLGFVIVGAFFGAMVLLFLQEKGA
jgi:hypothetical protein